MDVSYQSISTEVGVIAPKRTAVYLDSFTQSYDKLILTGELNSLWCEKKVENYKWYKYELTFNRVRKYTAIEIDEYYHTQDTHTPSVFCEKVQSAEIKNSFKTFVFETYDWAYIVECADHKFTVTGYR